MPGSTRAAIIITDRSEQFTADPCLPVTPLPASDIISRLTPACTMLS